MSPKEAVPFRPPASTIPASKVKFTSAVPSTTIGDKPVPAFGSLSIASLEPASVIVRRYPGGRLENPT